MNTYCAPDLPFFETVLWYIKQIAAGTILIFGFIGLIMIYFFLQEMWKKVRGKK